MGERKVVQKYYPPDFDPAAIPRQKLGKARQVKVRMMLPMSVCCQTCGNYIYKGTKFNSRKEDVEGETYLGIQIIRFYLRCTQCSGEITIKTDPQNSDYVVEGGATRNYEPWRDKDTQEAEAAKKREEEEAGDAMKALENRTLDSKREQDILANLDDLKGLNARNSQFGDADILAALRRGAQEEEDFARRAEEAAARAAFQRAQSEVGAGPSGSSRGDVLGSQLVKRLEDDDEDDFEEEDDEEEAPRAKRPRVEPPVPSAPATLPAPPPPPKPKPAGVRLVAKPKAAEPPPAVAPPATDDGTDDGMGLLGGYASSSSG